MGHSSEKKFFMLPSEKNKPAPPESGAQADSKIGGLVFLDCFNRAVVNAGATVDTDVSVDDILLVALSDSFYGAVISAAAALNASVSNVVSHVISLQLCSIGDTVIFGANLF